MSVTMWQAAFENLDGRVSGCHQVSRDKAIVPNGCAIHALAIAKPSLPKSRDWLAEEDANPEEHTDVNEDDGHQGVACLAEGG